MSSHDRISSNETSPVLLGISGDECATCHTTDAALYILECHESDDFCCRDCLTKTWYEGNDDIVRCPACREDCGFQTLPNIEMVCSSDDSFDSDKVGKIRPQHDIMNNIIGFTATEARIFLERVFNLVADQVLDSHELGSISACDASPSNETVWNNPIYIGLLAQIVAAPKMMTSPLQLEEDLRLLLDRLIGNHQLGDMLARVAELSGKDANVIEEGNAACELSNKIRENWITIIQMWVELLAWRHFQRTTPLKGKSA